MGYPNYLVTAPVYAADAALSIESLYCLILSDAIARHKRMYDFDVAQLAGADAHALKVEGSTERSTSGRSGVAEQYNGKFEELLELADIQPTHRAVSGSADHATAVQTLLRLTMRRSPGTIYKAKYQGHFCKRDGIDVGASAERALCPVCGAAAELVSEERRFFRLSAFHDRLLALYEYRPEFIQPQFRGHEIAKFVRTSLKDFSVGREASGKGIAWPDDSRWEVCSLYAELAGYLGGVGFGKEGHGSDDFRKYWPANLHVVSREGLHAHAVHWPAMLMAADLELPRHVFAHGAVLLENETTDQSFVFEPLLQRLGGDALRYYLLHEVTYGQDAKASVDGLVSRYNRDLASGLGGLAEKIVGLVGRYNQGRVPDASLSGDLASLDWPVDMAMQATRGEVRFLFDGQNFGAGLEKIWGLLEVIDKLVMDNIADERAAQAAGTRRVASILHRACEGLAWVALLLYPVMPRTTEEIWKSLGQTGGLTDRMIEFETPLSVLMAGAAVMQREKLFPPIAKQA